MVPFTDPEQSAEKEHRVVSAGGLVEHQMVDRAQALAASAVDGTAFHLFRGDRPIGFHHCSTV